MARQQRTKAALAPVAAPVEPPNVAAAVGVAAYSLDRPVLAKQVELAMSTAVLECLARGVSINDSPTIKAAMMAARQRVRREAGLPDD